MDVQRTTGRLLGQVNAFRYATVPNAPTYRAVMQVCYAGSVLPSTGG